MRRHMTKILAALAFVSAVGTAAPAMAQVYIEGPGVEFGVGPRWHHHYYDGRPFYRHHYWRHYHYDYD